MLRYPVILAHGIFAHDREGLINFWGRIPDALRKNGADVFFGNTDAWGRIESNAKILKTAVEKALDETKKDKVNIIAHSKGGIDSRYYIWKHNAGDKVASLTTICTPHNGAEIADLIFTRDIVHKKPVKKALKMFGKLYGDKNPDPYNLNNQLTTKYMEDFNSKVTMDERVFYQSLYTTMKSGFNDPLFFNSFYYVKKVAGENDGVVSERSFNWSNNVKKICDKISHGDILDYKKKKISGINVPDIYVDIIRDLGKRGF